MKINRFVYLENGSDFAMVVDGSVPGFQFESV